MNSDIKISFITRTKNREIFLRRLAQNLSNLKGNNFEWIIVNDAGEDVFIYDIINSISHRIPTQYVKIAQSRGRSFAANTGVNLAHGDFVLILDDDDYLNPDFIEKMISKIESSPNAAAICCHTQINIENVEDNTIKHVRKGTKYQPTFNDFFIPNLANVNPTPPCGLLIRKENYNLVGGYPEFVEYTEDWCFIFQLALTGDIIVVPEVLSQYSYRPNISGNVLSNTVTNTNGKLNHLHGEVLWKNTLIRQYAQNGNHRGLVLLTSLTQNQYDYRFHIFLTLIEKLHLIYRKLRLNKVRALLKAITSKLSYQAQAGG